MTATAQPPTTDRLALAAERAQRVIGEVNRVYIGPSGVPDLMLVSMIARGHVLIEGVPGVAKTTLAKAFAATMQASFKRIQFTPDLMPADITGTYVLSPNEGVFTLREGPIFAHVVLGDEINRAPAKTQSALLEAMQEAQATIDGETRPLPQPFMVLATQNPVEQAGTYPLPEAQIDRFLMRLWMGYPTQRDEMAILTRHSGTPPVVSPVLSPDEVLAMQSLADGVHAEDAILDYVVRLAAFTRDHQHVALGASPRASLALLRAAKARALIEGRPHVLPDDIKQLVLPVLGHRIIPTPEAQMDGVEGEAVVKEAVQRVPHRAS